MAGGELSGRAPHGGERRAGDVQGRLDRAQVGAGRRTPRVRRGAWRLRDAEGAPTALGERLDERSAQRRRNPSCSSRSRSSSSSSRSPRRCAARRRIRACDNVTGLCQKVISPRIKLRREVDLVLARHREFSLVSIELGCTFRPAQATARLHARASSKRWAGCCGNTRAMDALPARRQPLAVLFSGVGLRTAHSRTEGLRRQCATQIVARRAQSRLHRPMAWRASRTPRTRRRRCCRPPPKPRFTEAQARRKPRHAGQHPLRAGVSWAGPARQPVSPFVHPRGRQRIEHEGEHAL